MAGLVALRWSSILAARGGVERDADLAFGKLCRTFQPAVVAYIRHAVQSANAEDMAKDFFSSLQKRRLEAANHPLRGRFRLYLRGALSDHLRDLPKLERSSRSTPGPERAFDHAWAQTIIERAMAQLEAESTAPEAPPQPASFAHLKGFLTATPLPADYARLAKELNLQTNSLAVATQRLKLRLGELLQVQVADTLLDPHLLPQEFSALRGSF